MTPHSLFSYAPLLTGLLYLAAAGVVYRKEAAYKINRRFSLLCFAVAVWCLSYFLEEHSAGRPGALLFWARMSHLGGAFAAPLGLHFILRFTRQITRGTFRLLVAAYSMAGVVALFLFTTPWVIQGVVAYSRGHRSEWGPLYPLFIIGVLYCYLLMIAALLRALRRSASNIEHNRIAWVFTGTLLMTVTTLMNFLPALGVPAYAPGYLGALCFMLLVLFGIYRYRLMDIRQALARYLLLLGFWISMGFCYAALLRFFEWAWPAAVPGENRLLFDFMVIGFFVLLYQTGFQRLLPLAMRRLYPLKSDVRALESALDARMAVATDSAGVARALLEVTDDSVQVPGACVYLRDPLRPGSYARIGIRGDAAPPARVTAPAFIRLRNAIVREELRFDLELSPPSKNHPDARTEQLALLESLGMEALVPLRSGESGFGFLAFAKKRFGGVYDREDLGALALSAGRAAARMAILESLDALKEREHLAHMGEMTATVAHEIKNPLGAIQGAADRLIEGDPNPARFTVLIRDETRRLDAIVRSFLGFARPAEPVPAVTDLVRLCERCAELFGMEAKTDGFTLTVAAENRPLASRIDPDIFRQIFFNIASNSLEACVHGRLSVTLLPAAEFVQIDFNDNCGGMTAEALERVFQPFFTTKTHGTGLGMALVRKLVERMHGNIYIESVKGTGTHIRLSFPLLQPE